MGDENMTKNDTVTSASAKVTALQCWQCPVCGKVNAPFVAQCPCGGNAGYVAFNDPHQPMNPAPAYPTQPYSPPQYPPWWNEYPIVWCWSHCSTR